MINEIHMRRKDAADRTSHDCHVHDDLKVYQIIRKDVLNLKTHDRQRRPPGWWRKCDQQIATPLEELSRRRSLGLTLDFGPRIYVE